MLSNWVNVSSEKLQFSRRNGISPLDSCYRNRLCDVVVVAPTPARPSVLFVSLRYWFIFPPGPTRRHDSFNCCPTTLECWQMFPPLSASKMFHSLIIANNKLERQYFLLRLQLNQRSPSFIHRIQCGPQHLRRVVATFRCFLHWYPNTHGHWLRGKWLPCPGRHWDSCPAGVFAFQDH
jgi:hypothetical protein